jgi:fatty acid desaturase
MFARYFRYQDGVVPNLLTLSFVLLGYPTGIVLLVQDAWLLKMLGCALVCLTLVWSAYFIHEFAHQAIFKTANANRRWGTVMSWINGSCYARFDDMRRKHMRHHVERADVISFDVQAFLRQSPTWFRKAVLALEWAYIPAVEFLMRGFVVAQPFTKGGSATERLRVLGIFTLRGAAFFALGWYSPTALVLYGAAYLLFVTVLRFADCFQHTYDAYPISDNTPIPKDKLRDKAYEQFNTYSNIVGLENRWLNMLWLNFGYHNAHHDKPAMPWHRLPALHRELYDAQYAQVVPVSTLLKSFHINRVRRVMASDYGAVLPPEAPNRADGFLGAVGVSFLTAV